MKDAWGGGRGRLRRVRETGWSVCCRRNRRPHSFAPPCDSETNNVHLGLDDRQGCCLKPRRSLGVDVVEGRVRVASTPDPTATLHPRHPPSPAQGMAHQCRSSSAGSTRPVRRGSYISALCVHFVPVALLFHLRSLFVSIVFSSSASAPFLLDSTNHKIPSSPFGASPDFTNPRQTLLCPFPFRRPIPFAFSFSFPSPPRARPCSNSSNSSCSSSGSGTIGGTSGRGMSPGGTTVSTAVGASLGVPYAAGLFGLVAALILL